MNTRAHDLFARALELDGNEREAFLAGECGDDAELRLEVQRLLVDAEKADSFFGGDESLMAEVGARLAAHAEAGDLDDTIPPEAAAVLEALRPEEEGERIGPYKLLQEIGEGGFGSVWMAEQTEPISREVALKVIKVGMDTREVIARFEAERQALAMMDHPNIAKVLDAGATERGRPYFVMELVKGIPITHYCDEAGLGTRERLALFQDVCSAINHAHQKGIIHRDIKPSNLLVTLHGDKPVVKVIDFGIAKATQGKLTDKTLFTRFEQFIGTPVYMSPEQAVLSGLDIDTRSDIYALGVLLYELLTGKPPFDPKTLVSAGYDEMRRIIREVEPPKPSLRLSTAVGEERTTLAKTHRVDPDKVGRLVEPDLDWIVMKAIEKDRTRRYDTANALSMDIKRFLAHEPVLATPPSAAYQFRKFARRHKGAFRAAAVIAIVLVAATVISTVAAIRAIRAEGEQRSLRATAENAQAKEAQAREEAQRHEIEARRNAYASDMNVAKLALDGNNLGRARELLDRHRPKEGEEDQRGWEWRHLWQQTRSDALDTVCRVSSEVTSLVVSPDGNLLAVGSHLGDGLSIRDLRVQGERGEVTRLAAGQLAVRAAFSPAEPILAFTGDAEQTEGGEQHTLSLYSAATRQVVAELPLKGRGMGLTFSPDGKTLVTYTVDPKEDRGTISLWDVEGRTRLRTHPVARASGFPTNTSFATTPDFHLAAYPDGGRICVMDLQTGEERWRAKASTENVIAVAFSPDGNTLATAAGFAEKEIRLWSTLTGEPEGELRGHNAFVSSLAFHPDGKQLASSSGDQTIRVWDLPTGTCRTILQGHLLEVWRVAWLSDGQTLVSGSKDGEVCLWNPSKPPARQPPIRIPGYHINWTFRKEGRSVLTAGLEGITRWSGPEFGRRELLVGRNDPRLRDKEANSPRFSADGRFLAFSTADGTIEVWDLQERAPHCVLTNAIDSPPLRFIDGGNGLISRSLRDRLLVQWDLRNKQRKRSWSTSPLSRSSAPNRPSTAASPDGQTLMAVSVKGEALHLDLDDGSSSYRDLSVPEVSDIDFSPDGGLFAISSHLGHARVWESSTWREVKTLRGYLVGLTSLAFSPDGHRLVTGSDGKEAIRFWDTTSWRDVLTLEGEGANYAMVQFSPDGSTLGGLNYQRQLFLWRAPSWEHIRAAEQQEAVTTDP